MKRSMTIIFVAILFLVSASQVLAGPGFPTFDSIQARWQDGPDGAFRPHDGAIDGRSWYVDGDSGNDTNNGSQGSPFATITRALEAVSGGDTIIVKTGVYHEQVSPGDISPSADRANPVKIIADPPDGTSVVIDGQGVVAEAEGNLDAPAGVSFYKDSSFIIQGFAISNWTGYGLAVVQSSDVKVLDCTFSDNGTDMNDSVDLVLLGSRGARIFGNTFDSATERAVDDKGTDSWIANNVFSGHKTSAVKIGPQPAGMGSRLEHNVFIDNPATQGVILAREVVGITVQRNLVVRGNLNGITIDDANDSVFMLNTVVGFHAGIQLRDLSSCKVEGNILYGNTIGVEFLSLYMQGTSIDYNLYYDNTADTDGGEPGTNSIMSDPVFADPSHDDYSLDPSSAAIDAGPPGMPVPEGGDVRIDMGAFEAGAGDPFYQYQSMALVQDLTPSIAWNFNDQDDQATQSAYRVQVDRVPWFDSNDLMDSNWQSGTQTSWTVPHEFKLTEGRWYIRFKTRDNNGADGPWSDPHLAVEVAAAPTCTAQSAMACDALSSCDGQWLAASDEDRCCAGQCVACADSDNDGYQDSACGGADCDDTDENINPDAQEICDNSIDDNCDGMTDLDDTGCGCVDHDQDGYGQNCEAGEDCDDTIASVHPGAEEQCNYVDDDCDGDTDEGFDLQSDPENCGECFWQCHAEQVCDMGSCADSCQGGRTECDRACIDTSSDLLNCGGCGKVCELQNASQRCSGGQCLLTSCDPGWVDANSDTSDGCEYQCTPSAQGVEICGNEIDDNCDGQVDEGCEDDSEGGCSCKTNGHEEEGLAFISMLIILLSLKRRA